MSGSSSEAGPGRPILVAAGLRKAFPGVQALDGVDIDVRRGEVHVLVGENGAGKSTLVRILSGIYQPDGGRVTLDGEQVAFRAPHEALQAGVATVHQEFNLCTHRTVAENVFLGREHRHFGLLDRRRRNRETVELMGQLDIKLDPNARIKDLGIAERQLVEILKALAVGQFRLVIMDEPTAALSRHEIEALFRMITALRDRGVGVIYISHRLEEIEQVGDRVTVFRDGKRIVTAPVGELSTDDVIERMVGRPMEQLFPDRDIAPGEPVLEVTDLSLRSGRARNVSLSVRRGEVLGLFGLIGAGRTETIRALLGVEARESGNVSVLGHRERITSPRRALQLGLGIAPEDRKRDGIFAHLSVAQNISVASLQSLSTGPFVTPKAMQRAAARFVESMRIATPNTSIAIEKLSGGNQQKCIVARLLAADTEVLLLDEPTRGIDVGARQAVYELINDLAARGKAIVMVSSDLPEVVGMCDRVMVFRKGVVSAEFQRPDLSEQAIMHAAVPLSLEADEAA
jgi:ribose transport system ATP-binding protein